MPILKAVPILLLAYAQEEIPKGLIKPFDINMICIIRWILKTDG